MARVNAPLAPTLTLLSGTLKEILITNFDTLQLLNIPLFVSWLKFDRAVGITMGVIHRLKAKFSCILNDGARA